MKQVKNVQSKKEIKKINLDHIKSHTEIKSRCKFVINNLNRITKYDTTMKDKYGAYSFWYYTKDATVNFYWHKAQDIYERAVASTLKKIEAWHKVVA